MSDTWRGIYPIASFVRDALRKKAASRPPGGLSESEETLRMVCEFWFAVNTGGLAEQLNTDPIAHLLRTERAFTRLGALRIAGTLRAAVAQLARISRPVSVRTTATQIEQALSRTEDSVDDLIAHFASVQQELASPAPHVSSGRNGTR